jgi:hypothetical protein
MMASSLRNGQPGLQRNGSRTPPTGFPVHVGRYGERTIVRPVCFADRTKSCIYGWATFDRQFIILFSTEVILHNICPIVRSLKGSSISITYFPNAVATAYSSVPGTSRPMGRPDSMYYTTSYTYGAAPVSSGDGVFSYSPYGNTAAMEAEAVNRRSSGNHSGEYCGSPPASDTTLETSSRTGGGLGSYERSYQQRRPANRDEFDGPHQLLPRPASEVIAEQERELPHLPTNLVVQEQDSILARVNDRLSRCAFDFVAKYEFPIPLDSKMRPVERPEDREWTEWVYLLKRLATKRRIPARVLYNGQIKQFVTILENSLEMRHAAKHQSRPLKDDRNILQLISAGIQVAKLLKDAEAMAYLDLLYVNTENTIQERVTSQRYRA